MRRHRRNKEHIDPDALSFFSAIEEGGGEISRQERRAVSDYVKQAKNDPNAWWDSTHADYPMVGGTAASCAVNLKNPGTFDLTWVNTVAGDFTSTGWTPNGVNSYARTGLLPSAVLTLNSVTLEYYSRDNTNEAAIDMGCLDGFTKMVELIVRNGGNTIWSAHNDNVVQGRLTAAQADASGGITASRNGAGSSVLYRKGVSYGSIGTSGGTLPAYEIIIGARANAGVISLYSTKESAGNLVADGLTAAQALAQYNARQAMNTALSRQV